MKFSIFNFSRWYGHRGSSTKSGQFSKRRGIASLPAILLLGGVILEIAIAGAFLLFYLNTSVYGTRLGNEALMIAQAGIEDARMRVILNKSFEDTDGYVLQIGDGAATVTVCLTCIGELDKTQVVSVGTVLTRQHRLEAILNVDSDTGLVTVDSIIETPE
ncbi:MAG: hypothetical protein COU11_04260 [Candidatus Harrisonbacteria bacterium CG10_big_fil_rev_8_21_14_0_10_49_15]|uniref:Uncharacterized protein n=1 Tax=Candidatus Harrisonbacteria bacterium CG10_big_fil_rev_8_21_14_0_10_49_15 TaxID=1974587 RepID=A0A2H0ULN2_9BACT|nr:MAG: hypothetical protein COU11_04260 [Candidatus Harrisonbacteria bacterium CG10_big_fil_rev_8_21_14_0_10_49_15]